MNCFWNWNYGSSIQLGSMGLQALQLPYDACMEHPMDYFTIFLSSRILMEIAFEGIVGHHKLLWVPRYGSVQLWACMELKYGHVHERFIRDIFFCWSNIVSAALELIIRINSSSWSDHQYIVAMNKTKTTEPIGYTTRVYKPYRQNWEGRSNSG